jgi:hypothetical protein
MDFFLLKIIMSTYGMLFCSQTVILGSYDLRQRACSIRPALPTPIGEGIFFKGKDFFRKPQGSLGFDVLVFLAEKTFIILHKKYRRHQPELQTKHVSLTERRYNS